MKKVYGVFIVFFFMSSVGFARMNCAFWGYHAAKAEEDAYGEMGLQEFTDATYYYQGICEDAGGSGNIQDPVFL